MGHNTYRDNIQALQHSVIGVDRLTHVLAYQIHVAHATVIWHHVNMQALKCGRR